MFHVHTPQCMQDVTNKYEFKKEVGISIKSKETSSYTQLETASYHPPASIGYCWLGYM